MIDDKPNEMVQCKNQVNTPAHKHNSFAKICSFWVMNFLLGIFNFFFFTKSLSITQTTFLLKKFIPKRDLAYLLGGSSQMSNFKILGRKSSIQLMKRTIPFCLRIGGKKSLSVLRKEGITCVLTGEDGIS